MIIEKSQCWDNVVDHYYDNVHWSDGGPRNIYDWLKQEYDITSDTGSQVLKCADEKKGMLFALKWLS